MSNAAPQSSSSGSVLAYRLDHPKYGIELSIYHPDGDWADRGWVVTPLFRNAAPTPADWQAIKAILTTSKNRIPSNDIRDYSDGGKVEMLAKEIAGLDRK